MNRKQNKEVKNLISKIPEPQLEVLIESGLLTDILNPDADIVTVDRNEFRKVVGLRPLNLSIGGWLLN